MKDLSKAVLKTVQILGLCLAMVIGLAGGQNLALATSANATDVTQQLLDCEAENAQLQRQIQEKEAEILQLKQRLADIETAQEQADKDVPPTSLIEIEPNDDFNKATKIPIGRISGELVDRDDKDCYQFEIPHEQILYFAFTPGDEGEAKMRIDVYDAEQKQLFYRDSIAPGVAFSGKIMMNTASGGSYYAKIRGTGNGQYTLKLSTEPQNDAGSGTDAGDQRTKAIALEIGKAYTGGVGNYGQDYNYLLSYDGEDWYQFEVPHQHIFQLAFMPEDEGDKKMRIDVYDPDGEKLFYHDSIAPGVKSLSKMMMNTISGGTYYVKVTGNGQYHLKLSSESQNDAGTGTDAGDERIKALMLEAGTTYSGAIGNYGTDAQNRISYDREDWYQFEIPHELVAQLTVTPDEHNERNMRIDVYNPKGEKIFYHDSLAPGVISLSKMMMNTSSGGIYYVQVTGNGQYHLKFFTKYQTDAGTSTDAGDERTRALTLETGKTYTGGIGNYGEGYQHLFSYDQEDWYQFEIPHEHVLQMTLAPDEEGDGKIHLEVFDSKEKRLFYQWDIVPGMSIVSKVIMNTLSGGTYYAKVSGNGQYVFELSTTPQNDAGSGKDAGDEKIKAMEIESGASISGGVGYYEKEAQHVISYDNEDWYEFTPAAGQQISFTPDQEANTKMHIEVYNVEEKRLFYQWDVTPGVTKSFLIEEVSMPPYFIKVSGNGRYTLEIK